MPKYRLVEVTDMLTLGKSYKIYELPIDERPPLAAGLTREDALARMRELTEEAQS